MSDDDVCLILLEGVDPVLALTCRYYAYVASVVICKHLCQLVVKPGFEAVSAVHVIAEVNCAY